jgi:hypothetical protein
MIIVKHKRPIVSFITGKWQYLKDTYFFYLVEEEVKSQIYPLPDAEQTLLTATVLNKDAIGYYDKKSDSIIYTVDSNLLGLEIRKVPEEVMTNYIQVLGSKDVT